MRSWLPDDPYPAAEVAEMPDLEWSPTDEPLRDDARDAIRDWRRRLAELDQQQLLGTGSTRQLLIDIAARTRELTELLG